MFIRDKIRIHNLHNCFNVNKLGIVIDTLQMKQIDWACLSFQIDNILKT